MLDCGDDYYRVAFYWSYKVSAIKIIMYNIFTRKYGVLHYNPGVFYVK